MGLQLFGGSYFGSTEILRAAIETKHVPQTLLDLLHVSYFQVIVLIRCLPTSSFILLLNNQRNFRLLFLVETQTTIGYGERAINEQCEFGILVLSLQCIVGLTINSAVAGIIFTKFVIQSSNRAETIVFSKNATITLRNQELFLLCRVADLRSKNLLEAKVRMVYFKEMEETQEGRMLQYVKKEIKCGVQIDGTQNHLLLIWPTVIAHKIDENSPFFEMGPKDLLRSRFELIVILDGIVGETARHVQVRTSYLPNEMCWGHNFDNEVMSYIADSGLYLCKPLKIINKLQRNNYTPYKSAKHILEDRKYTKMQKDAYSQESAREDATKLEKDGTLAIEHQYENAEISEINSSSHRYTTTAYIEVG